MKKEKMNSLLDDGIMTLLLAAPLFAFNVPLTAGQQIKRKADKQRWIGNSALRQNLG